MEENLDLFKLHSSTDTPPMWIWVKVENTFTKNIYESLVSKSSQTQLSLAISIKLQCGKSTIQKHLIRIAHSSKPFCLPLAVFIELYMLSSHRSKKGFLKSIIGFKSKDSRNPSVRVVRNMTESFAKIIGAHVSDGYLQKYKGHYAWKVSEGKQKLTEKLALRVNRVFGFMPVVQYYKEKNVWLCKSKNKVFCRYLEKIVGLPTGKKSHTISEPEIIKKSNLNIRNAFLSGMLNFDGCVKTSGVVSLTSMSGELIRDAEDIFRKNGILVNVTYNKKKKSWIIETSRSRDSSQIRKLLPFFEKGTYKYNRLKFFDNQENYSLDELTTMFPKERLSKISLRDVYNASLSLGKFNTQSLSTHCLVSETTLFKYLYILNKAGLLIKEETYERTNKNGYISVQYHAVIS